MGKRSPCTIMVHCMKKLYHNFMVIFYYYIGDIACHFGFTYKIYQWAMKKSIEHDEKTNWNYWKEPQ
jgi:hypothetical protein